MSRSSYNVITMALLLLALILLRGPQGPHSTSTLILASLAGLGGLVTSMFAYPMPSAEERKRRFRLLFDIQRPEETGHKVFQAVAWLVFFVGSPLLFLYVGPKWVLLDGNLYLWLLYVLPVFFLASFLVPKFKELERYPFVMNILGRLGFCVPTVALLAVSVLAFNGAMDQSAQTRLSPCLGKRGTYGSHPIYYIRVRPWADSQRDVEVEVPRAVYDAASEGTPIRLTIGKGRLGLEWIRRVDAVPPHPEN
ncbi:MAG TPA: hypothetical protein VN822_00630 [Candidatus Acidoferrales bacterium]|nr:hypothetical protein [Candidatus Acidoferrales bacterium]